MEEFIFDDDVEDVGAEIEAHCPKCRGDTTHVIVSKYEDEVRKVQCNVCSDVHAFKKPRGESEEEEQTATPKKKQKAKPTYDQVMAKLKKPARPYAINEFFKEPEVLSHPKFGIGFVSDNIGEDKIEVSFQTEKRVLIHNRKNLTLPFLRELNPPKESKTAKKGAKEALKPVAVAAPPPAKTKPSAAARPAAKKPAKPAAPAPKKPAAVVAKKKPPAKPPARKPAAAHASKKSAPPKAAKKHKK